MPENIEYRVVYQREGCRKKVTRYATRAGAERRLALLTSDEPWKVYGKEADEPWCCEGRECGCYGETARQQSDKLRAEMPRLLFARFEEREVGPWRASRAREEEQSDA